MELCTTTILPVVRCEIPEQDAVTRGQLKVLASDDTYLLGGSFAAERMVKILEQAMLDAKDGSYGTLRAYSDMEWAAKNLPHRRQRTG